MMKLLVAIVLLALAYSINAQTCGFTYLKAGATCGSNVNNTLTRCTQELNCHATNSSSICTLPSPFGGACSPSTPCVSNNYATVSCVAGQCIYLKHVGQVCRGNGDCYSNNCTVNTNGTSTVTGVCQALPEFRVCGKSSDCGFNLYCNKTSSAAPTGLCVSFGRAGEGCSASSPCAYPLGCAIPSGQSFGVCRAPAAANGTCSSDLDCAAGLVCGPSSTCIPAFSRAGNATCTRGNQCAAGLACGAAGTCQTASSVACTTVNAATRCKSSNNAHTAGCDCGFCFETVDACAAPKTAYQTCLDTNCPVNTAPYTKAGGFYAYDNSSCAANCVAQFNTLQCCFNATVSGYVFLPDTRAMCNLPSPSASPSASASPNATVTPTASASASPSGSATATPTATPTSASPAAFVKASAALFVAAFLAAMML